jgi:hypothetical protein
MLKEGSWGINILYKLPQKKGTGHIEMLLGFTFFIGTILFLFIIMKTGLENAEDRSSLLNKLESEFSEFSEIKVTSFFVKLNQTPAGCVELNMESYKLNSSISSKVWANDENKSSSFDGSLLKVSPGRDEFHVYFSEDFKDEASSGCLPSTDYEIGPAMVNEYHSKKKISELKDQYYSDYSALQNKIQIGGIYDFAIDFEDEFFVMNKTIPQTVDVYTKEFSVKTINEFGEIEIKNGVFKIW